MARLKLLMIRAQRLKRLHNAGAKPARIMSGGPLDRMKYGVSVVGLSNARLALVRNRAACALRRKRMDSLTMSLMLVNGKMFDPIFDATLGPAMAWSVAHWLNVIPKEWIVLWKKMVRRLESARKSWARTNGRAAVVDLSSNVLGFRCQRRLSCSFLKMGQQISAVSTCTVRCLRRSGFSFVVLAKCGNGRNWLPVGRRLRSKGSLISFFWKPPLAVATRAAGGVSANDAATFRACLKMQLWPKDRKALHGLAGDDDQLCDLCKECIESLEHRNWECVHTVGFRAELIEKFPTVFNL